MNLYTFTCDTRQWTITAASLADAVIELPPYAKAAPAELSVKIEPLPNELSFWKARARELEQRLHQQLHQREPRQ